MSFIKGKPKWELERSKESIKQYQTTDPSIHSLINSSNFPPIIYPPIMETHPPIYLPTHPPTYPFIHPLTHTSAHPPIQPTTHSFIHLPIQSSTHQSIHTPIYPPIIHLFTYYPSIHLLIISTSLSSSLQSFLTLAFRKATAFNTSGHRP